jgi:hypothetical protein
MILSGRATVRTRRTTSFSSVSSTPIQSHHAQSRPGLHSDPRQTGAKRRNATQTRLNSVDSRPSILVFFERGYESVCDLVRQIFQLHGHESETLFTGIAEHGFEVTEEGE